MCTSFIDAQTGVPHMHTQTHTHEQKDARQTDRRTNRQKDRDRQRQRDGQTNRTGQNQTDMDRQTDVYIVQTHSHTHICMHVGTIHTRRPVCICACTVPGPYSKELLGKITVASWFRLRR